jgi:hypothetical protein
LLNGFRWYYAHVFCAVVGYLLGVAGFGIGVWLGNQTGNPQQRHRDLGAAIVAIVGFQVGPTTAPPPGLLRMWGWHWAGRGAASDKKIDAMKGGWVD